MIRCSMDGRLYGVEAKTSTGTGKAYATATIQDSIKDREGKYITRYTNLLAFGQIADYLKTLSDGTAIIIEGSLEVEAFSDKGDGRPRASARIMVDHARKPVETRTPQRDSEVSESITEEPVVVAGKPSPFA